MSLYKPKISLKSPYSKRIHKSSSPNSPRRTDKVKKNEIKYRKEKIKVAVWLHPTSEYNKAIVSLDKGYIVLDNPQGGKPRKFSFDYTNLNATNLNELQKTIADNILDNAIKGYNACLIRNGYRKNWKGFCSSNDDHTGMLQYISEQIFKLVSIEDCKIVISIYEVHSGQINDLLGSVSNLQIHYGKSGTFIDGVKRIMVFSKEDIQQHVDSTLEQKSKNATSFIQLELLFSNRSATITLVDLSDSEEVFTNTQNIEGRSQTILSKVVSVLAKNPSCYIPYRDSYLTMILRDMLGGNTITFMLTTISADEKHYSRTLSLLTFADMMKRIVNKVCVNFSYSQIIKTLKSKLSGYPVDEDLKSELELRIFRSKETNSYYHNKIVKLMKEKEALIEGLASIDLFLPSYRKELFAT